MITSGGWHRAERYIAAVEAGEILAPQTIHGIIARHRQDLERTEAGGFPYYFDADKASAIIDAYTCLLRHSIGEYAGMPFVLEDWQAFALGLLFGWKQIDNNTRRFRELYWSMGRKNGKSALAAGLALLLAGTDVNPVTGKPESVAEVVLAATKKEQVDKVIYAEVLRMRNQSPSIKKRSTDTNKRVTFKHNNGFIHGVGSDRPFDGLNPHACLLDEVHAFTETHREFYNTMTTGSGNRTQPLNAVFTTAGNTQSYLWEEIYRRCRGVAVGDFEGNACLPVIYELDPDDDPLESRLWIKANPNLNVSVKEEYLAEQAAKAATSRQELNKFTRYHGNRCVSALESAFDLDQWDECGGMLSDWSTADAVCAGIDLGGREDFAGLGMCARFIEGYQTPEPSEQEEEPEEQPIYRYELKTWQYIASDTRRDLTEDPFCGWVADGRITVCKHPQLQLIEDLCEQCDATPVVDVAFDPSGGQHLKEILEQRGFLAASMAQTTLQFNAPIAELLQCIRAQKFRHNGCPVLRWCAGNAVTITDRQERVMFEKRASKDKIDPIVAGTMAFARAMYAPQSTSDYFTV